MQDTTTIDVLPPLAENPQPQPLALRIDEGLEPATAQSLKDAFEGYFRQADEWRQKAMAIQITRHDQVREMKLARETRLALREIRINAEKARKRLKEDSLKKGKAIDGIYNMLAFAVEPLEKHLLEQEQFVERMEAERIARLKAEREEALIAIGVDVSFYNLGEMEDTTFHQLLETHQIAFTARQEAAKKAEAERIERERQEAEERARREAEAAAERERLRAENERLAKEKAEAEAKAKAEREAAEKARLEAEAKAKAEIERIRAEREAEARAAALKAKAEREAREKLEAEIRAKQEAEAKAKADAEAATRAAAAAPDRDKLDALAQAILDLQVPNLTSNAAVMAGVEPLIREQVIKFSGWVTGLKSKLN